MHSTLMILATYIKYVVIWIVTMQQWNSYLVGIYKLIYYICPSMLFMLLYNFKHTAGMSSVDSKDDNPNYVCIYFGKKSINYFFLQ